MRSRRSAALLVSCSCFLHAIFLAAPVLALAAALYLISLANE